MYVYSIAAELLLTTQNILFGVWITVKTDYTPTILN